MSKKLIKVYAVVAKKEIKKPKSFLDSLFNMILRGGRIKEYNRYSLAVFSTRKKAEKWMDDDNNLSFDFHPQDCRIQTWRVDYEILWKEWNKKEEK